MTKIELIKELYGEADKLQHRDEDALDRLIKRTKMILKNIGKDKPYVAELLNINFFPTFGPANEKDYNEYWITGKKEMLNLFGTIIEELTMFGEREEEKIRDFQFSNRIFIVHGRDKEMEVEVARTIEKLGLEPIVLHEKPDKSLTLIEKFTNYSDVGYAIVLLSPDDYGYSKEDLSEKKKLRARQNVILELGFFLGRLGRDKVLCIHRKVDDFEFPSDYSGVLYKPYDEKGNWKFEIVRELKALGYNVSADKLL